MKKAESLNKFKLKKNPSWIVRKSPKTDFKNEANKVFARAQEKSGKILAVLFFAQRNKYTCCK